MKNNYLQMKRALHTALLILLLSVAGMTNGYAQGNVSVGNFAMHLDGDTHLAIVISCDANYSCSGVLTIPSTVYYEYNDHIQSYTVVEIAGFAFDGCTGFTSLNLPGTLLSIGNGAFMGCTGFTGELVIPNSVTTIGASAFQNCTGFTGVLTIPPSVTVIESNTFAGCTGFSSIVWPENLTTIGYTAFAGCTGLTGTLSIPNTVTSIGDQAFKDCTGITGTLNLPTALTTLGSNAFQSCSGLSSVVVPASVTSMGIHVFRYCDGLSEVYYNAVNCANCNGYWPPFEGCGGSLFIGEGVERIPNYMFCSADFTGSLVFPSTLTEIGNRAFEECDGFTGDLVIPNAVTLIGTQAFNYCTGFNGTLTLGNALTTIGDLAFGHCSGFTGDLIIPNSVTTIEGSAFGSCYGFTGDLIISNALTEIKGSTFSGCYGFSGSLVIPASVASIGNNAFYNCGGFSEVHYNAVNCADYPANSNNDGAFKDFSGTLYIGEGVERIPGKMFARSNFACELVLPNTVTSIGDRAFLFCDGFTGDLVIPDAVTTIGDYAFYDCDGFTSLTLGNALTTIGSYAFGGCNSLTGGLAFGNALTTIGDHAFYNCNGFTGSLTIPNSVTTIGNNAFYYCTGFNGDLTIGNSLTEIEESVFYHCSGFTGNLTIGNSVTTIGQGAFASCQHFTGELVIPNSVTTIGYNAFNGCGFTGDLVIPNSVTTIGTWAFYGCTGFNGDLTISNSVTTIEQETFRGCNGFTGCLTIGSAVETIGDRAFYGCRKFSSLKILPSTPPTLVSNPFSSATALYAKPAYIPCGTLEAYQAASGWSNFTNYQEVCDTFEVFVEVVGEGTVSGSGTYGFGQTCTLIPTANPGYVFDHWVHSTGELVYDNPYIFTVTANIYVGAFFVEGNVSHEYVDLGLPSGTLWATSNVGAATPEAYGDYFAWGETQPKTNYKWSTYQYCNGNYNKLTKYCDNSSYGNNGFTDNLTMLLPEDDAATVNWGSDWRMPTYEEWEELNQNTTQTWVTQNGVNGILFTAANGNTLFLPCAGHYNENYLNYPLADGCYWSSSLSVSYPYYARSYHFSSSNNSFYSYRCQGASVRPVRASSGISETTQTVNLSQGWNWFSSNVEITLDDLKAALVAAVPGTIITMKSRTQNTAYNPNTNQWRGTLTSFDVTQMYMIYVSTDCEITLTGMPINPAEHPVTIQGGSNWIAFPLSENMTISDAFAGFAINGDKVKSRNGNSQYIRNRWNGGVTTLVPGQGYMYISNTQETRTFTFPISTK